MESISDGALVQRPSYLVSAEPVERPTGIDVDDIKLDLSHEFSLVASSSEESALQSKDHVQVCLRIRPFTPSEKENDSQGCVYVQDSNTILLKDPQSLAGRLSEKCCGQMAQKFSFSKVFGPETTQKEFFEGSIMQLVKDFLRGENRLIFTYGVTNSGKTYTFQGTEENTGILPRTMNMLFHTIQDKLYQKMDLKPHRCRDYVRLSSDQMKEEVAIKNALLRQIKEVAIQNGSCDTSYGSWNSVNISDFEDSKDFEQPSLNVENTVKFSIWVSFFEIYNEFIYDLFVPVSSDKFQKRKMLRLSQDIKGCSFIKDLQWIQVSDSKEAYRLLKLGLKHQSFASTKLNSASSRSHSIFTIRTLQIEDSEVPRVTGVSELSLCDLAGSERSMKTQNEGERLRETGNINTSLLTLGKCINALRNSQKSKLQQHVPFRESKLTHYFQSFFNGKGKIYMIVNISQCCSAYDETFNVLKFSAVAQKVFVPDALNFSQEKPFGQTKSSRDTSFIANNADTKMLEMKRTTIEWERSLEDLIEDEDLVENPDEAQDDQMVELDVTSEEEKAVSKEEYAKLLSLIEDLKNKLINEKKEKLTLELKIRDEVTQEFTQYLSQREADFKESLLQEREMLEENSEHRMAIFKDLVADFETSREEPMDETCTLKVESKESDNLVGIEDVVDSLQDDVTDIKKQAEIAHLFIASLADPQEAIACLELKYNQVTAELAKIQEEYAKVQQELVKTQEELRRENKSEMCTTDYKMSAHELENANKKIVAQDQRIQELMDIIDQKEDSINKLQNLVSHMEDTFKGCDETLFTIKNEISKLNSNERVEDIQTEKDKENRTSSGRKRSFDDSPLQQEELPIKKGPVNISTTLPEEQKETGDLQQNISEKEAEIRDLQEEKERLQKDVLVMEKELSTEKAMKEELHQQIASLLQELSCSKEKTSVLNIEVQQIRSDYESAVSELHVQKTINQEQEEKVMELLKEIATTRQNITNKVAQIKMMQTKIDKLRMLDCVPQTLNAESQNLKDLLKDYPDDNLSNPPSTMDAEDYSVNAEVGESDTECFRRKSSFHCSIEAIWEECKAMVNISSNKSNQIQQLEQQIEKLHEEVRNVKEENNHLKLEISENKNQGDILKEKENIINQLSEELEGKTIRLAVEEHHVIESEKTLSEFTQQITSLKEKIKELETILETKKDADNRLARLEQVVLEKESVILKLERNLKEFEENLYNSNKNTKELSDKEAKLKEEVTQLMNNLQNVNNSLQIKDKENEDNSQKIKKLKEELSANSALTHKLKEDLQRKEEDYVDLKEKFADAKKQIEQVQKEISIMRDQEKLLRNKVNELEKIKNQFSQELDVKQRTIQQLKEQLSNQNTEEVIQQYQNICKDLDVKEKIIEGMRATMEEQEQTQVEMEEMLEARSEEVVQLTSELEEWKEKCKNLETKISQEAQNPNQSDKDNRDVLSEELNQLREALQESEEKHQGDRKKWLEEKTMLITQAKEAENLRNREMKKYVEDRARCLQLHNEVERLTAQLANKDDDLQKWREERDKLVWALEVQLKTLISSNMQKDKEIEQLKRTASEDPGKDYKHTINELKTLLAEKEDIIKKFKGLNCENSNALQATALTTSDVEVNIGKQLSPNIQEKDKQNPDSSKSGNTLPNSCKSGNVLPPNSETVKREMSSVPRPSDELSVAEIEDGSVVVLDSSEVSTENEHMTRFPKSELEIQFTPLQPNKMSVKHPGSSIPVTVKISKPRKRKSSEMEENLVKYENKKNVTTPRTKLPGSDGCSSIKKEQKVSTTLSSRKACYSLRNQEPTLSRKSSTKKKDGTLQKFGEFLQHSPTILHSKAKKLIEKMSPSKPAAAETGKENGSRPKRAKRKLYTSEISSPLDIAGQVIFMDQKEKESDHQILKRRLRTRTAK